MSQSKKKEVLKLIKELYDVITINGEVNGFSVKAHNNTHAIPILENIIIYLSNDGLHVDDNILISNIKQDYLSLFPAKSGLSEFYVWSDDYNTRKEINDDFDEIHRQLIRLLNDY